MDQTQPIIQYTTVSDSVYLWVKNAIIQGEFKPGEHIAQERLTKHLESAAPRSATQSNVWKQRDF